MATPQNGIDLEPFNLLDNTQASLFDSLHRLSELKVSGQIETPQLVVVGEQSSGKSSVLEALVRFHFPVDNVKPTTRFPIKLVLRKDDYQSTKAKIESGAKRSAKDIPRLRCAPETLSSAQGFGEILRMAKVDLQRPTAEGSSGGTHNVRTFCDDTLVLELRGPSLPQLNLIDLPGVFSATTEDQTSGDMEIVKAMVTEHIRNRRNIVLLVLSATISDYSTSTALGMVQEELRNDITLTERVICVVTSPDAAASLERTQELFGNNSQYISYFVRPWHVLCNQNQQARENHQSLDERDRKEQEFFERKEWEAIPPGQKGIATLRDTLKSMIRLHIQAQLPHIISEVNIKIINMNARIDSMARERATPQARRVYLSRIAEKFSTLSQEAVNGTYKSKKCVKSHDAGEICEDCKGFFPRFGENDLNDQRKRLRANVRALNQAFATAMLQYGKTKVEDDSEGNVASPSVLNPGLMSHGSRTHYLHSEDILRKYKYKAPERISRKKFEDWVHENMDRLATMGPRGEPSDGVYSGLLAYQAKGWGHIATQHINVVWEVVKDFIDLALTASCSDGDVLAKLRQKLVCPRLKRLNIAANDTLRDLVRCHDRPNPGFYDSFVDASAAREHARALLERLAAMSLKSEDNSEPTTGANATATTITTNAEQVNGQSGSSGSPQQTHAQRHAEPKPKPQRSGEHKTKDRNQKSPDEFLGITEDLLANALTNVADAMFGNPVSFLNNGRAMKPVASFITRQIFTMIGTSSDYGTKEKSKRPEDEFQSVLEAIYPSNFGDISAARVIEQVELHYEGIRASFIGYVASLVVENKIMAELSDQILHTSIIHDLPEEDVESIAGERPENTQKRKDIEQDVKTMKEVLEAIEQY